uniref:Si:ch211-168d1.3 n=1 Tax=Sinocyclocheilus grahami TaxID=75366 RepID=A0A672NHX3_SINGR
MTAAFVCVFAPERRVARLVDELSHDKRSTFGSLVQDFLEKQRQEMEASKHSSAVELLQGMRRFLSQAKSLLLEAGEIEPPIETLVPENEKDLALEKALFGCVLKPLKVQLQQMLVSLHTKDGSLQKITDSLLAYQEGALERLAVRVAVLDIRGMDRAKAKLTLMQRSHSPIDKVLLLLQVCKSVYKAMGTQPGEQRFRYWFDFLPALSYVLVQCNIPQLLLETEYMMELLEPSWLTGEGGYYLTSVYASLCLIQSKPEAMPTCSLTNEAQEYLREWSRRRGQEAKSQKDNQLKQVETIDCIYFFIYRHTHTHLYIYIYIYIYILGLGKLTLMNYVIKLIYTLKLLKCIIFELLMTPNWFSWLFVCRWILFDECVCQPMSDPEQA